MKIYTCDKFVLQFIDLVSRRKYQKKKNLQGRTDPINTGKKKKGKTLKKNETEKERNVEREKRKN